MLTPQKRADRDEKALALFDKVVEKLREELIRRQITDEGNVLDFLRFVTREISKLPMGVTAVRELQEDD